MLSPPAGLRPLWAENTNVSAPRTDVLLSGPLITVGCCAALTLMPLTMAVAGFGGAARLMFPAAAAALGAVWVRQRPGAFIGLGCWLFLVTPFLRRVVDYYAGFVAVNHLMLAPYAVLLLTVPFAFAYIVQGRSHASALAVLLTTLTWGFALDLHQGRLLTGTFETLRWMAPLFTATYVLAHADRLENITSVLTRLFTWTLPVIGAYGLWQYISIPAWDAYWMINAPIVSIGYPEPFQVRVFATMNSPGSLAAAIASGVLWLLWRPGVMPVVACVAAFPAFALTMQRASQGAFLIVALMALLLAPTRVKIRFSVLMLASIAGLCAVLAVPEIRRDIEERFTTTTDLQYDESALARLEQHRNFPDMLARTPEGRGFAWRSIFNNIDGGEWVSLDSGIMHTLLALGIVAGSFYLLVLGGFAARMLGAIANRTDPAAVVGALVAMFGLVQLPLGAQHRGEHGFFLWLGLGVALAASSRFAAATPAHASPRARA